MCVCMYVYINNYLNNIITLFIIKVSIHNCSLTYYQNLREYILVLTHI